jgi:hypothetical protein
MLPENIFVSLLSPDAQTKHREAQVSGLSTPHGHIKSVSIKKLSYRARMAEKSIGTKKLDLNNRKNEKKKHA